MLDILGWLKKIPLDLAQGQMAHRTKGKYIALSLAGLGKDRIALDAGCGDGWWTEKLKAKGFKVYSIDRVKSSADCQVVDLNSRLPYADNFFDLVWLSEVIEHLNSPTAAVKEFLRVLKPGGDLIITTPNSYFILMRPWHLLGFGPNRLQNPDHQHFFSLKDINRLVPGSEIYGYFPYWLVKLRIQKFVGLLSPTFIIHLTKNLK